MEISLNNKILSRLTGAPVKALEKKGVEYYKKNQSTSTNQDVYLEGVIVGNEDGWLAGFEGFVSPANMREKFEATSGDINLFIDSPGGSVWGASNMLTQVIKMRKEGRKINVIVTGLCASAATYFLFEADSAAITPLGDIMVHRSWSCQCGNAEDFEKAAGLLKKTDAQYVEQLTSLTGRKQSEVDAAVKDETWFTGKEAVEWGLVGDLYTSESKDEDEDVMNNDFRLLIGQLSDFNY